MNLEDFNPSYSPCPRQAKMAIFADPEHYGASFVHLARSHEQLLAALLKRQEVRKNPCPTFKDIQESALMADSAIRGAL